LTKYYGEKLAFTLIILLDLLGSNC